jgi:hypothetical protein
MIAHGKRDVKVGLGPGRSGREPDRIDEIAGNPTGLSIGGRERSWKIFSAGLGGHQNFLINDLRRGRFRCRKRQLKKDTQFKAP